MQALGILEPIGPPCAEHNPPHAPVRFLRSSNLVSRQVSGDTVVVPICRGVGDLDSIFTFNAVGTFLWELLAQSRTVAELAAQVAQRFAIGQDAAQEDVRAFLADLREAGLVQQV